MEIIAKVIIINIIKKAVGVCLFVSLSYQLCDGILVSFFSSFPVQYILKQSTAF